MTKKFILFTILCVCTLASVLAAGFLPDIMYFDGNQWMHLDITSDSSPYTVTIISLPDTRGY